jgi:hypothetical protein
LEKALHAYTLSQADERFDMKTVPVASVEEQKPSAAKVMAWKNNFQILSFKKN